MMREPLSQESLFYSCSFLICLIWHLYRALKNLTLTLTHRDLSESADCSLSAWAGIEEGTPTSMAPSPHHDQGFLLWFQSREQNSPFIIACSSNQIVVSSPNYGGQVIFCWPIWLNSVNDDQDVLFSLWQSICCCQCGLEIAVLPNKDRIYP